MAGHTKGIMSLDWCPKDSDLLVSCGKDNSSIIWNTQSGEPIGDLSRSANWAFETSWCPSNPDCIAVASYDGKVTVHSLMSGDDDTPLSPIPVASHEQQQQHIHDPNDPFASLAGGSYPNVHETSSDPQFTLPHAPKWLRRPVGAVWGFANHIAIFEQQKGAVVSVKSVPWIDEFSQRVDDMENLLNTDSYEVISNYCHERAHLPGVSPNESDIWTFLKTSFTSDIKEDINQFLGFNEKTTNDERLTLLLKKLNIVNQVEELEKKPFTLIPTKQSPEGDIDILVTKATLSGDFETAVNICLASNRIADALVFAINGGDTLYQRVEKAYFKQNFSKPYARVLKAILEGDLTDIISNTHIDASSGWREIIGLICSFAQSDDFPALFSSLGERLKNLLDTVKTEKDKANIQHAVSLCHIGSGSFEKAVDIWLKSLGSSKDPNYQLSIQRFIERISALQLALGFVDPEISGIDNQAEYSLRNLYEVFIKYAHVAVSQGKVRVAYRYLDQIPVDFVLNDKVENSKFQILRDRVYNSMGKPLNNGELPLFPYEMIIVGDAIEENYLSQNEQRLDDVSQSQFGNAQAVYNQQSSMNYPQYSNVQSGYPFNNQPHTGFDSYGEQYPSINGSSGQSITANPEPRQSRIIL
jgi:protein transport protein SEC31